MKQPNVLFISEQLIPSSVIAVVKPFLELQKQNKLKFTIRYTNHYKESDIEACDIIVLCRQFYPNNLTIIELARKHNKKIIYDIDDNFFELSVDNPLGQYHRHPMHLYGLTEMIKNADAVRVYSHPMKEIADKYNSNVHLVKSYFDFSMIADLKRTEHDKIRIVYATSRGKNDTLAKIYLSAVARILDEFEDKVEFYAFGQIPDELKDFDNTIKLPYKPNYSQFIRFFYSYSFDIGLAPLINDRFHNSKTNNKFREYGAMGVCGVYSDVPIYSECVTHGVNGMLVDNSSESWYIAIKQLITDKELRQKIRRNAAEDVKKYYSMENTCNDWQRIIETLPSAPVREFNNILRLNVGVAVDCKFKYTNFRNEALYNVLHFCGIKNVILDQSVFRKKDTEGLDVIVCFITDNKDVDFLADKCEAYGIKNIIFDTMIPFDKPQTYENIIFTNSTKIAAENVYQIDYRSIFDKINLDQYADYVSFSRNSDDFDYMEEYFRIIEKVKKDMNRYYSDENAQFLWAELLSRYKGTNYNNITVFGRIKNKAFAIIYKISNKLNPIFRKFSSFFTRCNYYIKYWCDYIKINIFKNY